MAVPVALRKHKFADGTLVAVATHEVDIDGVRAVAYDESLAVADFIHDNHDTRRAAGDCPSTAAAITELAGIAKNAYEWGTDVHALQTNTMAKALLYQFGTVEQGIFWDDVKLHNPQSAKVAVVAFKGTTPAISLQAFSDGSEDKKLFCDAYKSGSAITYAASSASYPSQANSIVAHVRTMSSLQNSILFFTGHSLGGALAALQAAQNKGCAVGFNNPPASFLAKALGYPCSSHCASMTTYRMADDMVSETAADSTALSVLGCNEQGHSVAVKSCKPASSGGLLSSFNPSYIAKQHSIDTIVSNLDSFSCFN